MRLRLGLLQKSLLATNMVLPNQIKRPVLMVATFAILSFMRATASPGIIFIDQEIDRLYGHAASERGAKAQREALDYWSLKIKEAREMPSDEAILLLSSGLNKLSEKTIFQVPETASVRDEMRNLLLSIPGHANYYEKRLRQASDAYFTEPDPTKHGRLRAILNTERSYSFPKLEVMPSAETVRVLGDFLYDDRGSVPHTQGYDDVPYRSVSSNSRYALRALAGLPLETKPLKPRKNNFVIYDQDINAWKLWYEQVKAGTRTFRFEGDPQNYTLAGPVAVALAPSVGGRSDFSPAKNGSSEILTEGATRPPLGLLVIAVALFLGALCYWRFAKAHHK